MPQKTNAWFPVDLDALFVVGALNLSWLALSLTVVLLPPATVALFESMDELASGRIPGIRD